MKAPLLPLKVEIGLLLSRPPGPRPALFLDLDGTIRTSAETFPLPGRQAVLPAALYRAWQYRAEGYWVIGVSNQSAVARGERTWKQVEDAIRELQVLAGGLFDAVYVCPHSHSVDGALCQCKKPQAGMGKMAMAEFEIELARSLVVGDSEADEGFAENLGLVFQSAEEFHSEAPAEDAGELDPNRALGALLGLACGDSLGANLEFHTAEQIASKFGRVVDFFSETWPAGAPTDDTDLALIWLRHFAEGGDGFSYSAREDLGRRLRSWLDHGPTDVGVQTAAAIRGSKRQPAVLAALSAWESSGRKMAGNGALMRCAPVAVRYWNSPGRRLAATLACSAMTHADPRSLWACVALNEAIASLLRREENPLLRAKTLVANAAPEVAHVLATADKFEVQSADLFPNMGYVLLALQVAFSQLLHAKSLEEALIEVVNRGGDADTNAAVTGALLGAKFGKNTIPRRWLDRLQAREEIEALIPKLFPSLFG